VTDRIVQIQHRLDLARRAPAGSTERIVLGVEALSLILEVSEELRGACWEARGILGLRARPESEES
jgi:hypothetical protein